MYCVPRAFVPSGGRAFWCKRACAFDPRAAGPPTRSGAARSQQLQV